MKATQIARRVPPHRVVAEDFLHVEDGVLILRAPKGLVIEVPEVSIRTTRTSIESQNVDVTAAQASLHVGEASVIADAIRTTADEVATRVGRWELHAKRVVEDVAVAVRDNRVVHATVERMRLVARDAIQLFAKRTAIVSEEDTTVDGKRVLLG